MASAWIQPRRHDVVLRRLTLRASDGLEVRLEHAQHSAHDETLLASTAARRFHRSYGRHVPDLEFVLCHTDLCELTTHINENEVLRLFEIASHAADATLSSFQDKARHPRGGRTQPPGPRPG